MTICCNKKLTINKTTDGTNWAKCEVCGKKGKGKTEAICLTEFEKSKPEKKVETQSNQITVLKPIPKKPDEVVKWFSQNVLEIRKNSPRLLDKTATDRMMDMNTKYILRLIEDPKYKKVTATDEGMVSVTDAFWNAVNMGATLGDMGDIVPFGSTAEFIPSVECFKFVLENGKGAPFEDIDIQCFYEHDQVIDNETKNGNFTFSFKKGLPRGEVVSVIVSGIRTDVNKRIGEIYDADRLIEKAKRHSPSYKNYLIEKDDFKRMEVEGKLKKDSTGRMYFEKKIDKRDGGTWDKKIYADDIVNPYDGPDRPEMLRKSAGKSFFGPYMKTRNASAMADEWQEENDTSEMSLDKVADHVLDKAMGQFTKGVDVQKDKVYESDNIKDAEIVVEKNVDVLFDEGDEL